MQMKNDIRNTSRYITVRGAAENNLRGIDLDIPTNEITVVTGVSGCGKSSLAFNTIYAEGQRRYLESLSAYARMFVEKLHKPRADFIDGLSPAISIEQKTVGNNPRSTVGTITEVYDYLRILYANIGVPHCPKCGKPIRPSGPEKIRDQMMTWPVGTKCVIAAPVARDRKGEFRDVFRDARRQGYVRARIDGAIVDLDTVTKVRKNMKHNISIIIDRLVIQPGVEGRLAEAIDMALSKTDGLVEVQTVPDNTVRLYSTRYACPDCDIVLEELTHRIFSYNSPQGWCPQCLGTGFVEQLDEERLITDDTMKVGDILSELRLPSFRILKSGRRQLVALLRSHRVTLATPWKKIAPDVRAKLLNGAGVKRPGILQMIREHFMTDGEDDSAGTPAEIEDMIAHGVCPLCRGQRLRQTSLNVRIDGRNISDFCALDIWHARDTIGSLDLTARQHALADNIIAEVADRLKFLVDVGLGYLTLDRPAVTLSGGEAQRTRLATQIGTQLTGITYVLDEPTIGLHQRDNDRLIGTLRNLRDLDNTVIIVEHDENVIRHADHIVDLGPGPGTLGGAVIAQGTPEQVARDTRSLTGAYLSGRKVIPMPPCRRAPDPKKIIRLTGAAENNLKDITVEFPLGTLIFVTGVSGSGKSTLVNDILYKVLSNHTLRTRYKPGKYRSIEGLDLIDKAIQIDQSPIGRTPRSNPATYIGIFDLIRDLFALLPESRARGYQKTQFSFNVAGGRCPFCKGMGIQKVEMKFLPDVYVPCDHCAGRRYTKETLEVKFHGYSISDVLQMTVDRAAELFANVPKMTRKFEILQEVGLGYLTLGQNSSTLSGGEAQRIKLAAELSRPATGRTVYTLDEPTTGLHFDDIRKLMSLLHKIVDSGNTVIIIEHNLDMIKNADWVIDLGPDGGAEGGGLVAQGTPEQVANEPRSITGQYLKEYFARTKNNF